MTFENALAKTANPTPAGILALVERFDEHRDAYHSGRYNETQLRRDFLDPFFKELGWDIDNAQGYAEAYRDVIHEDAIKIGGVTKAPDYSFRVGGVRKFFVEAKKPSVDIKDQPASAFQLRRYAWSAKLPLSILTDFEELAVYDCRLKPVKTDRSSTARVRFFTYKDYPTHWQEISSVFSREAILKGSFDKYAESAKGKRGTQEVDDEFLQEIESWRDLLARNIALRNPALSQRELNFAVQRTIDRIIFLRISEDRGIEPYGHLLQAVKSRNAYEHLSLLFRQADDRYNSGLFHFQEEKESAESPDTLTLRLHIDDDVLQKIIAHLYYPDSPYEFSVLSADILGQVYEQFLGKVIRLTDTHQAKIEEKPEVRKAGGVYYTPVYIVRHIVEQTLGKLLEGNTPRQAAKITVLDPACGSGSFLLGAYQYLLDWHRDWYLQDGPEKHRKVLYQAANGLWRLTTAERKRILLNNIYGVDIDAQAVEVTKLSLLLRVLEGETEQTLGQQMAIFRERVLPDLGKNIKCGNSLIGSDYYAQGQMQFPDYEERLRINAFDWEREFPEIFSKGGFDAVIGNPPYLSYSGRQAADLTESERTYLFGKYETASGWATAHAFFIELAVKRLSSRFISFIVPDQVGHLEGYKTVRSLLGKTLSEVRYWGEHVFKDAITPALTFVFDRKEKGKPSVVSPQGKALEGSFAAGEAWTVSQGTSFLERLKGKTESLDELVADPGVHTGNCSERIILNEPIGECVPVLEGKQILRYSCLPPKKHLRLDYEPSEGEYFTIRPKERYEGAQFLIRQTAAYPIVGPREHAIYFRNSLLALYPPTDGRSILFLVGILNSTLMRYLYRTAVQESNQKAFPQVKVRSLRALPIRMLDCSKADEKRQHDGIVTLVERMLLLQKKGVQAKTGHEQEVLQREIASLDPQIDQAVYKLYGLSPEEISAVEAFFAAQEA